MKSITRNHNMSNILDLVRKGRLYFYTYHVKDENWRSRIKITDEGRKAFDNHDFDFFEDAEAKYWGGEKSR